MKEYNVMITETLSRIITVEASSEREAEEKVKEMYNDEEIVLDWNDLDDTDIEVR